MKLSVYLHSDRVDVLKTFGNLNDVVDRILKAYDEGFIDIEDRPVCEPRDGAGRYDIEIYNENYLQMLQLYGVKSKRISLRRILYWFVDNEIYNDLGWEPINDYIDKVDAKINKQVERVISELDKLIVLMYQYNRKVAVSTIEETREIIKECLQ